MRYYLEDDTKDLRLAFEEKVLCWPQFTTSACMEGVRAFSPSRSFKRWYVRGQKIPRAKEDANSSTVSRHQTPRQPERYNMTYVIIKSSANGIMLSLNSPEHSCNRYTYTSNNSVYLPLESNTSM